MANRNSKLMKNTIILSIGQLVPKIVAIALLPILTGYLTKRDYWLYELTISISNFCVPLISVQIQQGVFRFLIDSKINKKSIITSSFIFVIAMFSIFALPIIIAWSFYTHDVILGILFFGGYLAEVLLNWAGQVTRGLGNNLDYSISYTIYSVVYVFTIGLFFFINEKLEVGHVIIAMICAYITAFLYLLIKARIFSYFGLFVQKKEILRKLLKYSAPMVISSVALWTVNFSDRFFVSGYLGIEMAAVYSVANRIPNLFISAYNIFNLAWTENTSRLTESEKKEGYYTDFFNEFYQVMVGMMLTLISFSPILFKILINNKYLAAYGLMSWLYVGVFLSCLVSFFGSIYVGEKRTKNVGISSAVGAIINVVINLLFMRQFGVIVAAVSTIVSYFVICVYRAIVIKKYVNITYNPFIIIMGLGIICLVATINNSYSIFMSIFSIIVTVMYNFIFNRQIIKNIMRNITKERKSNEI